MWDGQSGTQGSFSRSCTVLYCKWERKKSSIIFSNLFLTLLLSSCLATLFLLSISWHLSISSPFTSFRSYSLFHYASHFPQQVSFVGPSSLFNSRLSLTYIPIYHPYRPFLPPSLSYSLSIHNNNYQNSEKNGQNPFLLDAGRPLPVRCQCPGAYCHLRLPYDQRNPPYQQS